MNPYQESIDYLYGAQPTAFGQRAHDPRGWRWTMPSSAVGEPERIPLLPAQQEEDPIERLYKQIDALWEQYYALGDQERQLELGEVEDPNLMDIPLAPALPPMPAPAQVNPQLVTLSSIATMLNPLGGALYMGLPLAEREQRARSEFERWQALRDAIATQYKHFVTGIQALNDLQMEIWKLKRTKAEDLLRMKVQQVSSAKQRILDRISQLESTASRLRDTAVYRQMIGQAALMRAQTGQERLEAEKPLLEARAGLAQAQADLAGARAEQVRAITPPQVQLLRKRMEEIDASIRRMNAQTQDIASRVNTRLQGALKGGRYLDATDVDLRNMSKAFDAMISQKNRAVQEKFSEGYSLADEADRAELNNIISYFDEQLSRLAYTLYVSSGGRINRFSLLDSPTARDWEQRARQAVAQIERSKATMPVPRLEPRPSAAGSQPAPPPPKKEPSWWQRAWQTVKEWATSRREVVPPPTQPKPQVKRVRMTVTDDEIAKAKKNTPKAPIKLLDIDVR